MSGDAFLRSHGWKMGQAHWWHDRLPGVGFHFATALLQQAQWLDLKSAQYGAWIRRAMAVMERAEGLPELAGTDAAILMSKLLCEVP